MNIDDLRTVLNQDTPQGLDGQEVLAFAHRARTRRRIGAVGVGAAALVTAFAVLWSSGTLKPDPQPAITATPVSSAPSTVQRTPSHDPTQSPSAPEAASTPALTSQRPTTTTQTSTQRPITALCKATAGVQFTDRPGLLAAGPGGRPLVTSTGPVTSVSTEAGMSAILSLPERQGAIDADTDGRFVVITVALVANSGEQATAVYRWDSQKGGQAVKVLEADTVMNVQVRDGRALILVPGPQESTALHLVDLSTGDDEVVSRGEIASATLLEAGRYTLVLPAPKGVRVAGTGPAFRRETVLPYAPVGTNGSTWVFSAVGGGPVQMMVWSPAMPEPLEVFSADQTHGEPAQVGRNFALVRNVPSGYHLVDLRTGARIVLPVSGQSGPDHSYSLTPDDVLLRDALDERSAGPEPLVKTGWVDLSEKTLTC